MKHRAPSVALLTMCFQLRAASDHSRGVVQTQRSEGAEKWGDKTAEPCIESEREAVNKKDEERLWSAAV